jgi:cell division protein FtsX
VSFGWWFFVGCITVGAVFGLKGLFLPLAGIPALWIWRDITGDFVNRSGSGDNLAALGMLSAFIWLVVGVLGVTIGLALRALARTIHERSRAAP